jgi:hypothetical protein
MLNEELDNLFLYLLTNKSLTDPDEQLMLYTNAEELR